MDGGQSLIIGAVAAGAKMLWDFAVNKELASADLKKNPELTSSNFSSNTWEFDEIVAPSGIVKTLIGDASLKQDGYFTQYMEDYTKALKGGSVVRCNASRNGLITNRSDAAFNLQVLDPTFNVYVLTHMMNVYPDEIESFDHSESGYWRYSDNSHNTTWEVLPDIPDDREVRSIELASNVVDIDGTSYVLPGLKLVVRESSILLEFKWITAYSLAKSLRQFTARRYMPDLNGGVAENNFLGLLDLGTSAVFTFPAQYWFEFELIKRGDIYTPVSIVLKLSNGGSSTWLIPS